MLKQKIESRMKHTDTLQSWENHPSASRLFGRTRTPAATLRAETPQGLQLDIALDSGSSMSCSCVEERLQTDGFGNTS